LDTKSKKYRLRLGVNIVSSVGFIVSILAFMAFMGAMYTMMDISYNLVSSADAAWAVADSYYSSAWVDIAISAGAALLFLVLMTVTCGRKDESGKVVLNRFDRLPTDIQVAAFACLIVFAIWSIGLIMSAVTTSGWLDNVINNIVAVDPEGEWLHYYWDGIYPLSGFEPSWVKDLGITAVEAAIVTGGVIFYQCLVKKLKTGTFFRHTIIGKLVVYVYDAAKASRDVFWKVMGVCLGACILSATWFGIIPVLVCVFIFVPKWVNKYIALRKGIEEIAEGNIDYKIEITDDGELDRLSEKVNEISEAVSLAVDEELKSRQMKVDLISNVSHDLRTPLTSMITYIDLLKSEGLGSENAPEYLRIIDEKTVRLKKLTDDLFEAAKASSGAIPVNLEKIEMISIVNQALAEVGEKLDAAGLQILFDRKPEKAEVMADGQLLWRVIENLLTNAAKYAMPSSRVYIDISEEEEGRVRLEIKNVSREPLNISADELTERFTRGDRSRNTEGSGLGLSIAKDLTGLMGGEFKIYIDGDLFKAAVILERA
jgi:signal transduction histidine kinase